MACVMDGFMGVEGLRRKGVCIYLCTLYICISIILAFLRIRSDIPVIEFDGSIL